MNEGPGASTTPSPPAKSQDPMNPSATSTPSSTVEDASGQQRAPASTPGASVGVKGSEGAKAKDGPPEAAKTVDRASPVTTAGSQSSTSPPPPAALGSADSSGRKDSASTELLQASLAF